jgi:hypothetical protein
MQDASEQTIRIDGLLELLSEIEALQEKKVIELARRLHPGLTHDDIKNPHDFPELNDPDWHYADGVLTGIQTVKMAVLARMKERERP